MEHIKQICGHLGDGIAESTFAFPAKLAKFANGICGSNDKGPFPMVHVDYGHNNIVVTPDYKILGVIDWEHAFAAPWQTVDYSLTVRMTPKPMDAPWNYDHDGAPIDDELRTRYKERTEYLEYVKGVEENLGIRNVL